MSYDYGTSFTLVSDKFQLSGVQANGGNKQVISQFYHSPADNKRVSHCWGGLWRPDWSHVSRIVDSVFTVCLNTAESTRNTLFYCDLITING